MRLVAALVCLAAAAATFEPAGGKPARRKAPIRQRATARISFQKQVLPILRRNCTVGTGCHSGETAAAGLRLDVRDAYTPLVNAPSSLQPARMRVKPGKPTESVVWLKVTGKHKQAGIFGTRMPPTKPLPPADLRLIERWIRQGAPL
jgi:hypothetical protein